MKRREQRDGGKKGKEKRTKGQKVEVGIVKGGELVKG